MSDRHTPGPWMVSDILDNGRNCVITNHPDAEVIVGTGSMLTRADANLIAAAPDLAADLREAAATLRRYEALHRAKGTPESDAKADVNAALAARFEATLAKATGETP